MTSYLIYLEIVLYCSTIVDFTVAQPDAFDCSWFESNVVILRFISELVGLVYDWTVYWFIFTHEENQWENYFTFEKVHSVVQAER